MKNEYFLHSAENSAPPTKRNLIRVKKIKTGFNCILFKLKQKSVSHKKCSFFALSLFDYIPYLIISVLETPGTTVIFGLFSLFWRNVK